MCLEDPKYQEQAAYLFRRCTVYKVKFHAENHIAAHYHIDSVVDGSVNMLFEFGEGSDFASRVGNGEWKGPTSAEAAAPDVMVTSMGCGPPSFMTCSGAGAVAANAPASHGKLTLKRYYQARELGPDDKIVVKNAESGDNFASFEFTMPLATAPVTFHNPPRGDIPGRMEVGETAVIVVHGNGETPIVTLANWTREGYPTLFSKGLSGTKTVKNIGYTNKTKFEIVHRPDLYPPDQINPALELEPQAPPDTPPRQPARPKTQ